jgi:hypothetical protein
VRKITMLVVLGVFAITASDCLTGVASADGVTVRQVKKTRHVSRGVCGRHDSCGLPIVCPYGTCASLYGAYGPYGGSLYWSRYTYAGWGHRW